MVCGDQQHHSPYSVVVVHQHENPLVVVDHQHEKSVVVVV
jgi:hypothetical protein